MPLKPVSVTQLNEYIRRSLAMDPLLSNIRVRGEVSDVNYNRSGHIYFSLADSRSRIRCFLPRDTAELLDFQIVNGDALIVSGMVDVYLAGGSYSVKVKEIEKEGLGPLQIRFEQLKKKLSEEGLFDPARKKPIPFFPDTVGIITSGTGAAVKDMLKNITPRNDHVNVLIFPTAVQGEGAAAKIAETIRFVNREYKETDVLIVGRGGGSAEDLAPFNEECVARAIADSEIPVISAVGHEIDFVISDMAADARAETPTKAGLLAVPDTEELREHIQSLRQQMQDQLLNQTNYNRLRADALINQIGILAKQKLSDEKQKAEFERRVLELSDPRKITARGFVVVRDPDGRIVSDRKKLKPGETVYLSFRDGTAEAEIRKTGVENGKG